MEGRNKRAIENNGQMKMVEISSNMKACPSQRDTEIPVHSTSVLTALDAGLVETIFIKEERVLDDVTEVRVKKENDEHDSGVPLGREECALSQEVRVKVEKELDCTVNQEVRVKMERVSEGEDEKSPDNEECSSSKQDRLNDASVEGVRIKKEDEVFVEIESEYEIHVKEEEWSPGAAGAEQEASCEVVLGPEGPQPQDIFFTMRDGILPLNHDEETILPDSQHTKELLVPTCSVGLKPDSTVPAFNQIPRVIRSRTILKRKARTDKRTCSCEYCGKQFVKKTNLVTHIRLHMGINRYFCNTCNKAYTSLYNLTRHKLIHTGVKPYCCEICNKRFTDPCNLVTHRGTHKERETFTCKICNKQFKQNHSLKSHRRVHTGDKPFSCEICTRSFSNPSNLKRHYRVHTGEKPHVCKFCKKRYVDLRDLTRHERTHTEKPVPKNTNCHSVRKRHSPPPNRAGGTEFRTSAVDNQ